MGGTLEILSKKRTSSMQNTNPLFAHKETIGKLFCLGSVFSLVGKDQATSQGHREYFMGRMQTEWSVDFSPGWAVCSGEGVSAPKGWL